MMIQRHGCSSVGGGGGGDALLRTLFFGQTCDPFTKRPMQALQQQLPSLKIYSKRLMIMWVLDGCEHLHDRLFEKVKTGIISTHFPCADDARLESDIFQDDEGDSNRRGSHKRVPATQALLLAG